MIDVVLGGLARLEAVQKRVVSSQVPLQSLQQGVALEITLAAHLRSHELQRLLPLEHIGRGSLLSTRKLFPLHEERNWVRIDQCLQLSSTACWWAHALLLFLVKEGDGVRCHLNSASAVSLL